MSGEIVKKEQQETALAAYDPAMFGSDDTLATGKLTLPILKLCGKVGANTPETVRLGSFYLNLSGENFGRKITIHVIIAKTGRAKFKPDFTLECKSMDGVHGSTGRLCAECPFSQWRDDREDRKLNFCPPVEYSLVLVEGQSLPALLNLTKTLEGAGRKLRTLMNIYKLNNDRLPMDKKTPLIFYKFQLESFDTVSNGFLVQGVKVSTAGIETDPVQRQFLAKVWKSFKDYQGDKQFTETAGDEDDGHAALSAPQEATNV